MTSLPVVSGGRTIAPQGAGPKSAAIMESARAMFPGGVNSPVRAYRGVGGEPFVVAAR